MAGRKEGNRGPAHRDDVILKTDDLLRASSQATSRPSVVAERGGGREAHTAVQYSLVDKVEKLGELPSSGAKLLKSPDARPCICRVHPGVREQEREAYEPKLVSIGPLHRGGESLQPMEQVKLQFLRDLLCRSDETNKLPEYIRAMLDCEQEAPAQYAEKVELNTDDFVEMLVVDGCFIIEYMIRLFTSPTAEQSLFKYRSDSEQVRRDMLLLENQLPFFILETLFRLVGIKDLNFTLIDISLKFLQSDAVRIEIKQPPSGRFFHLLHLFLLCLVDQADRPEAPPPCIRFNRQLALYPFKKAADLVSLLLFGLLYLVLMQKLPRCSTPYKERGETPSKIDCATDLIKAGVKLRRKVPKRKRQTRYCFLNVSFRDGKLEIPSLRVDDSTSFKLRNLIALEQCCPEVGIKHFTSYATFMESILYSERDVAVLRSSGIIESKLRGDAEVAAVFYGLCKGAYLDYKDHANAPLFRDVQNYCDFAHHRWRAILRKKGPLITAGSILFVLTVVQAYFSIFPRN